VRTEQGERALRDAEIQHLVDVKGVLDGLFLAHGVALVVGFIMAGVLVWRTCPSVLTGALKRGVWFAGGIIALVLVSSLVDFDVFFTRFHQVFFSPGTWVFYARDTLIQLYPLPFWIDVVWKLGVVILAEAGILYAGSILVEQRGSR
jgi:integral membrane protein (TIGR01906 family)